MLLFNLKSIVCIICNSILLINLLIGYKDFSRKRTIINNEKPIEVIVKNIYKGRSRYSCEVEYNGRIYKNIAVPNLEMQINSINKRDFYFDNLKKEIISTNVGENGIIVGFVLFIFSLLLWLVPKKNFLWN